MKNRIKLLSMEKGISQTRLAEKLDKSKATINNIISGRQDATLETAMALSKIFNEPIENIFYNTDDDNNIKNKELFSFNIYLSHDIIKKLKILSISKNIDEDSIIEEALIEYMMKGDINE